VAHYLGAAKVLATDGNEDVVRLAERNLVFNKLSNGGELGVRQLRWGPAIPISSTEWDVIIGSDLTYNGQTWIQLAQTIKQLLETNSNSKFLYCTATHSQFRAELEGFRTVAESLGLRWSDESRYDYESSTAKIAWITLR